MATTISVWSRVLEPGQDALISEEVSVQITNITLEYDESKPASEKRSVVKMQYLTAHPQLLEAAAMAQRDGGESDDDEFDEGDSEIDSDEFGGSDDDEDDDEGGELDDELMADLSKVSKASGASSSSKKAGAKVNGDLSAELEGEDDDEDDEEEDSDDDSDYERQEAEVQICSLLPGKVEQFTTNLILPGDEDFVFKLSGDYKVHLFGHYIMQPQPDIGRSGREYDSDLDYDSEFDEDDLSEIDEELDEDDESRFMEIADEKPAPKKVAKEIPELKKEKKEAKAEVPTAAPTPAPADASDKKLSKNQLKKLAAKEKAAAAPAAAAAEEKKPAAKKESATPAPAPAAAAAAPAAAKKAPSKKQTLPSGLVLEDNKTGTGATAKSGQRVQMRYIGRLANGKIFDQNTKGAPFSFKLGKGEVIKGWDEGIVGMQVGGERRLVIPPGLAYGKQAIAGIPANSTLTFEVKLLSIK